jgi:YgiT-type zinc finger domain-containing protein
MHVNDMRLFQVQPCIACKGKTERRLVDLEYELDDMTLTIKGVPAAVCTQCGEQYIPGEFGVWLGDRIAELLDHMRSLEGLHVDRIQATLGEGHLTPSIQTLEWATA